MLLSFLLLRFVVLDLLVIFAMGRDARKPARGVAALGAVTLLIAVSTRGLPRRSGCGFLPGFSSRVASSVPRASSFVDEFVDSLTGTTAQAKEDLLMAICNTQNGGEAESQEAASRINGLIDTLATSPRGRDFSEAVVDGNWALVFTRNADGSPALQKLARTKPGGTFANFDVSQNRFENLVEFLDGQVKLSATVAYQPNATDATRISCDIVDAELRVGGLLSLPLPLRAQGGWLDFLYMDSDMRVTRGNLGGVFVHVRPAKLESMLAGVS